MSLADTTRIAQLATGDAARPGVATRLHEWTTTVDHKRIGILYGVTSFFFLLVGGFEALLIRLQLATPDGEVLSADTYNQLFTMHGTTMVFLVVMPLSAACFNFLIPLMIGARDVAFPRLNALSYWIFLFGGIFINLGFLYGEAPDGGWFGYAPLSGYMTVWITCAAAAFLAAVALFLLPRSVDEEPLPRRI